MSSELSMDHALINKLNTVLEANLDNELFGVKELTEEIGMSRAQLHRKLHVNTGKSTSQYIREFRLEKAMKMLQNNVATASEIAYRVGFKSPTYFNTSFREYYGYTPGEVKYRNPPIIEKSEEKQTKQPVNQDQDTSITSSIDKISSRQRILLFFSVGLLLIIAFSYYFYFNSKDTISTETTKTAITDKSIAIIPFKNLSEAKEDEFFTMGVTSTIQNQLNRIGGLKVISENSMKKYANTKMIPSEIAKEIGVTFLLNGSVQKYGDSIRIITHFINAKKNQQLSSMVFDWEYNNIFTLQSNIAKQVAEELNIQLSTRELEQIDKKPTKNLEAYNLYLKGRFFWHRRHEEDLNKSIYYFNQALKLDSTYALAYAGLADTYFIMVWHGSISQNEAFNKGKELALKALSIDNTIAEAHATLGAIANWYEWDWEEAEKKIKKAIVINPNYASAYQWYAELLDVLGRNKEALEQIEMALKLNPNSCMMNATSAMINVKEGNFDKALIDANRAKEIDKTQGYAYWILFECYWNQGKDDDAIAEMEEWWYLEPNIEMAKGSRAAYDKSGIKGVYKYIIDYDLKKGYASKQPFLMAEKYAFLGENEKALEWLEKAFEQNLGVLQIYNNPYFKNFHSEPRFKVLLKKMNLGNYD